MSDLVFEFLPLYLPCVIAALFAVPLLVSKRIHRQPATLVALSAACNAVVAVVCSLISFSVGWMPFHPLLLLPPAVPAAVAGALLSLAALAPFAAQSPRFRLAFRITLSVLAPIPALFASALAVLPIWAPLPP